MPPRRTRHGDDGERVLARDEGDEDAGVAVAGDERRVRAAVHRRDLDHAGEPRRRAAERAGEDHEPLDGQAGQPRRARVAADDAQREAQHGAAISTSTYATTQAMTPKPRPQCTSSPGSWPEHVGRRRSACVEGLFRLAGSRSGPSTRWLNSAMRDVGEQQARDRLVHAAVLAQRAGQRDPRAARRACPRRPSRA